MTDHPGDPSMYPVDDPVDTPRGTARSGGTSTRPRWLLPSLAVGVVVAGLVVTGVVPLSSVLYVGLFGGMMLMHLGGHGMHGGHGGRGRGGHAGGGTTDERSSSESPRVSQPDGSGSSSESRLG